MYKKKHSFYFSKKVAQKLNEVYFEQHYYLPSITAKSGLHFSDKVENNERPNRI